MYNVIYTIYINRQLSTPAQHQQLVLHKTMLTHHMQVTYCPSSSQDYLYLCNIYNI